jgi:hypothetical protein
MPLLKHHITDHLQPPKHTQKYNNMPWNCCVARLVSKDEIRCSPGAQTALRKEWDRLRLINTWKEDAVEEWDVVKARAKRQGVKIHTGMVFRICVEKNSETEKIGMASQMGNTRGLSRKRHRRRKLGRCNVPGTWERTSNHGCCQVLRFV